MLKFLFDQLKPDDQRICELLPNFIDHALFRPGQNSRIDNRVLCIPKGKHRASLATLSRRVEHLPFRFKFVENVSQSELIVEYQKADIFVHLNHPEGFGLPPLEAMACGCVVVGYHGGGGQEFMLNEQTALIADNGDIDAVVSKLEFIHHNPDIKTKLRANGLSQSQAYNKSKTKGALQASFSTLWSAKG